MITPDELNLYKKLQPLFREKMGTLVETDLYWCDKCQKVEPYLTYCCEDENGPLIILPLPIDPVNPERGLLGMIRRFVNLVLVNNTSWRCLFLDEWYHGLMTFSGNTPTLALLRALEAQMEERK